MALESNLIPILREGVEVIKMIVFKDLRTHLSQKYRDEETVYLNKLAGAIINDIFGSSNAAATVDRFAEENKGRVSEVVESFALNFENLRIPLTDALRTQFLCDHQEGFDGSSVLRRAKELDILVVEREVPLPAQFVSLVRRLGGAYNILAG
jgi:hypothetical protein